jgi:hypothetical protein
MFFKDIHNFQTKAYNIIVYVTWALYISIILGLSTNAPQYLDDLQYYVKMYVSLFLIIRFNPFRKVRFTELDGRIAFSAGVFLLATTAIDTVVKTYLGRAKQLFI